MQRLEENLSTRIKQRHSIGSDVMKYNAWAHDANAILEQLAMIDPACPLSRFDPY
jgi:hypothetical protein